jgi:branched-chain amino acid transport system ATP-binding protein
LSKRFGGVIALKDVTVKIEKGELVGLIGPNGAGKTTLYNCITGFYKPDSGSVKIGGRDATGLPPHKICMLGCVRTFQVPRPFLELTLLENVMVGALGRGRSLEEAKNIAMNILDFLNINKYAHITVKNLNLNYRRRCELARALATSPKILFMDETLAGLNPTEIDEMLGFVKKIYEEGLTIVMTEHVMKAVMSIAERIAVLHQGEIICEGTPKEVANDAKVIDAYLGKKYL